MLSKADTNFHPIADLFPLMEGKEFEDLRDDINEHGLRDPVMMLDGMVLDGRNRVRACQELGVEVSGELAVEFSTEVYGDPMAWVISKNLKRRHLNETQRAWVAAKVANLPQGQPSEKAANLPVTQEQAAAMLNVSERSVRSAAKVRDSGTPELQKAVEQGHIAVSLAQKATGLAPAQQREVAKNAAKGQHDVVRKVMKKHLRKKHEAELGKKIQALPDDKYGVIVADPPWKFETYSEDGKDRAADSHYATSSTEEIKQLDVAGIAARECVLFLWATAPILPQALEVMTAWGFAPVTHFVWVKNKAGTGYWNRNKHELLLVGTRGNVPAPAPGTQWPSVIEAPVGKHSAKPEKFLEMIEEYFPNLPKIELNRRGKARKNWAAWGAEAETENNK